MKIYVASSWRNDYQPVLVQYLVSLGHEVYDFKNPNGKTGFSWSEIDPEWINWTPEQYTKALNHPIAIKGFNSDFDAMKWADCCIMVLPCGRSANTEAGWMKGSGKPVYVWMPVQLEPELMYKIYDDIVLDIKDFEKILGPSRFVKMTGLEQIDHILTTYDDYQYASMKLEKEKEIIQNEVDYIKSQIDEYHLLNEKKNGWINTGKLFFLNKNTGLVYFIYYCSSYTPKMSLHYDPSGKNQINSDYLIDFSRNDFTDQFVISENELDLINQCNLLYNKIK